MLVLLCYLVLYLHGMPTMTSLAQKATNMYVFGDSIVDYGRKTQHETGMKAGYRPYGTECIWTTVPFQFTNGQTFPEIIASSLNLSSPISFDEFNYASATASGNGVNYASASAGILPETGSALGRNYCMEQQIGFFRETVEKHLRPNFPTTNMLSEYLSSAIFLINIGTSDYIHNYLQPKNYNSSHRYNGKDFAELLTKKLGKHLEDLYNLGARKIIIFQIGPLGCFPYIINKLKPESRCDEDVNKLVSIFNDKLDATLKELSQKLVGSTFVIARTFDLMKSMIEYPFNFGFKEARWPCCKTEENGTGLCQNKFHVATPTEWANLKPDPVARQRSIQREFLCVDLPPTGAETGKPKGAVCEDRKLYIVWDEIHLTEAAYKGIANHCLVSSDGISYPSYGLPYLMGISG
ncbi:GDSL esterase/lipase 7 [Camellia lanceoleosa]|uniref:GDSL esterase/lipase 7 n=1 Tax=Camellia lanceoleosa TaxID=1840588 RepID=A0ACC0FXV2_9ERIC|nr:GDSL esterase/lipase 7 [Camellia lanceoleosa]